MVFRNQVGQKSSQNVGKSGVGIGLSNAKCLTSALNGAIDLQSKPDKGTIVNFSVDIVIKKEKPKPSKEEVIS